ncbi:MAG TPA: amidohydrolase family protein, partial [Acidimicrobiales bacterium]
VEVGVGLRAGPGEDVIDAGGNAVVPGLHDHHVHLRALAAANASIDVGSDDGLDALRTAPGSGWVRAVGYHESIAGPLDRHRLDELVPDRPVRVQHRSGALWVLNSTALDAVGAADQAPDDDINAGDPGVERDERGVPTGRLWRADRWLADRVPPTDLDLAAVGRAAAERGVTGFTDADPDRTAADVALLHAAGLPQALTLMSADGLDLPDGVTAGPRKRILDDTTLPTLDELAAWIADAHHAGHPVAVHCVTRVQMVVTVTALTEAAALAGDRIEHGGVVPPELHGELRRLGVTVVTQPNFVAERGDRYRVDVDPDDLPHLYPCGRLRAAGVRVAAGTDAPFGRPDPWAAVRAAVHRRTRDGHVLGPGERVDPATALALFQGFADDPATPRRVAPGQPADLLVLDRPLAALHRWLDDERNHDDENPVTVTIARGEVCADRR